MTSGSCSVPLIQPSTSSVPRTRTRSEPARNAASRISAGPTYLYIFSAIGGSGAWGASGSTQGILSCATCPTVHSRPARTHGISHAPKSIRPWQSDGEGTALWNAPATPAALGCAGDERCRTGTEAAVAWLALSDSELMEQLPEARNLRAGVGQLRQRPEPPFREDLLVFGRVVIEDELEDCMRQVKNTEHLEHADTRDIEGVGHLRLGQFRVLRERVRVARGLHDQVWFRVKLLLFPHGSEGVAELALCHGTEVLEWRRSGVELDRLIASFELQVIGQRKAPKSGSQVISRWYVDAQVVASGEPFLLAP